MHEEGINVTVVCVCKQVRANKACQEFFLEFQRHFICNWPTRLLEGEPILES